MLPAVAEFAVFEAPAVAEDGVDEEGGDDGSGRIVEGGAEDGDAFAYHGDAGFEGQVAGQLVLQIAADFQAAGADDALGVDGQPAVPLVEEDVFVVQVSVQEDVVEVAGDFCERPFRSDEKISGHARFRIPLGAGESKGALDPLREGGQIVLRGDRGG